MPETMKAAVYYSLDDIRLEERPVPEVGPDEMLLRTLACGLCGGETMPWYKKAKPKVIGHEPIGEVVAIGDNIDGFDVGERLFVHHHVASMNSHWSLRGHYTIDPFFSQTNIDPGGVCEFYKVTADHLAKDTYRIPDWMTTEAATTIEPWACVIGGLKTCNIQPGDTVAVVGAGFMGQGFVHLAPFFGAGRVFALDLSDWRLAKTKQMGATFTINPNSTDPVDAIRSNNDGLLADVVIVIAPSRQAWNQALALVERGGTLHLGAPLAPGTDWTRDGCNAYFDEITVTSKFSADHIDTYNYFRLLKSGRIFPEKAITHRFGIDDAAQAFRMLVDAQESLKIIMYPNGLPDHAQTIRD
ncbi:MAG: zinc-binding dehydrogenase, partial [Phycisphaerales bacterium]|nr:zinc-binding dehydrogenase [Phycisphaerales bacterium]